jgi:hypothetical protein
MSLTRTLLVLLLLIGGLAMSASSGEAANVVTLDVYSGRPNPSWTLSDEQVRELRARIEALASSPAPPAQPGRLGYRGLTAELPGLDVSVFRGDVTVRAGASVRHSADTDRQLERWLLDTGRDKLSPDLMRVVEAEIARHG